MSRRPDSTLPSRRIPAVVVVTPGPVLLAAFEAFVHQLPDVPRVKAVELEDVATLVAEWRPFAVVVPADVFAFDPQEFEALARDVGAEVMTFEAQEDADVVAMMLLPRLRAAQTRWDASEFGSL